MFLGYPTNTPFGNLNLAEAELFHRVDYTNVCIEGLYDGWKKHVPSLKGFVRPDVVWLRYQSEYVVHLLRRLTDTLIAISCILGHHALSGAYPDRIVVDSIGLLLKKLGSEGVGCPAWVECYRPHRAFLTLVNDISNTYKHHFVNYETVLVIAVREPSAFYLPSPQNKATSNPDLQGVAISRLVELANRLISTVRKDHRGMLPSSST